MIYFVAFLIVYFLHVLLKLHWITTVCLLLFAVCMIPLHEKKRKEAYRKIESFFGMSLYLDTILYSFVKEEKVEQALMDTAQTLPRGTMKDLVQKAAEYLQMTFDKTEVLEAALKIIEEEYPCKRLKDVHQFMTHVEYYGGEIELPVGLLLSDKSRWEQRIKKGDGTQEKAVCGYSNFCFFIASYMRSDVVFANYEYRHKQTAGGSGFEFACDYGK